MLNTTNSTPSPRQTGHRPGVLGWSSRLGNLPRDARDTLFLLTVIGWVVLMQVGHLPWWCIVLTAAVLTWRSVLTVKGQPLPGWGWRMGLLALTLGATWFTHGTLLGRDAGVTLIVVLLSLKTLEMRARRDAFVVFFLAFFTLLTHFFYSQSLLTAAGILIALLGLLTALVNAHMPVGRPPLAQSARIAAGMALMGAPVMLVLFLLFPRFAPLWGIPSDGMTGRSGLSNTMRVGEMASLVLNEDVALRIRFEGDPPAQRDLYFRGPVLSDFDGLEWRPLRSAFPETMALQADLRVAGDPVAYEVTMEPNNRSWLLVLDSASEAPRMFGHRPYLTPELQWRTDRPLNDIVRYKAQSYTQFQHGPETPALALQDLVDLPGGFNPRTLTWAQELRRTHGAGHAAAPAIVAAVMDHLRTGGYSYTLEPGVYGRHTADEFWFDRREGFCEHIASSFVILMRALDIPARIVTGYQGGERNPVDGFWTVRQSDAHAWTEVWLQGQGWVRVDPTSAVSPGRVGSFERLQAPAGFFSGALRNLNPTLAAQVRAAWEAVNNRWNQWVLNFTQGRQLDLLKSLGFETPSWRDLAYVLIGVVVAVSLAGAGWSLWERQQHDPWLRLLQKGRSRLRTLGIPAASHQAPRALAEQVRQRFGDTAFSQSVTEWLIQLEAQRYSARQTTTLATLQRDFHKIPWPKGPAV